MDGRSEWSSAFAARPLAARGFIVVQVFRMKYQHDHDHYNDDKSFGKTADQAARNLNAAVYEGAVEYLDRRGLIDRERVGIVGFSRTVSDVAYTLTHSRIHFAAASLVDGVDGGYFQYMAFPHVAGDFNQINGGISPFGDGLLTWAKESPSFSLDRVDTPVRLVALQPFSILESWEWYVGLHLQKKPVDFILFPNASHIMNKPRERLAALRGLLDWFRFWLKHEEDADPSKAGQYARWRELREEQSSTGKGDKGAE
jgi:dipeptidyl aminopeptidase/acylaminoacyl peptidase